MNWQQIMYENGDHSYELLLFIVCYFGSWLCNAFDHGWTMWSLLWTPLIMWSFLSYSCHHESYHDPYPRSIVSQFVVFHSTIERVVTMSMEQSSPANEPLHGLAPFGWLREKANTSVRAKNNLLGTMGFYWLLHLFSWLVSAGWYGWS